MRGALMTAAAVAGVTAILFGKSVYSGFPLDASHRGDIYPLCALFDRFAHYVGQGVYPWYFPEFGSGAPVAAAWMYGLFSPATLLFGILPAGPAWVLSTILHFALAAFGVHLLCRELGMRSAAAATAGVVYCLSEWMVGRALCGHINLVWPAAWAPLVFWAVLRAARGRPRAIPTLGLLAGIGLLSGHLQLWFYAGPVLVVFAVLEIRRRGWERRAIAAILLGGVLAAGIAAVQWSFTLEYFSSLGDIDVPEMKHSVFTTPATVMAAKPFPGFLGYPPDPWRGGPIFYHESFAVGGLGVLFLAALGLADRRRGRWFWLGVVLFGLLIAGGNRNVVSGFVNSLPPLSSGRAAGRGLYLAVLGVAMLAGRGVDAWLATEARLSVRRIGIAGLALGAFAGGCLLILCFGLREPGAFAAGLPAVLTSVASLGVVLLGLLAARRLPRAAAVVPLAVIGAVCLAGLPPFRNVSDDFYRRDPLEYLPPEIERDRVFLLGWGCLPVIEQHGYRTNRPILPVDSAWYGSVMGCGAATVHRWLGIGVWVDKVNASDYLLDDSPPPPSIKLVMAAVPPGSLFAAAERNVPEEDAIRRLAEEEIVLLLPGDAPPLPPGSADVEVETVERTAYGPGHLEFRTRAGRSRWLYVTEKFYVDWAATIDGRDARIHRANVSGMALAVPAGEHEVAFRYRPASATWGPILTVLSVLLAGVLLRFRRS